MRNDEIDMFDQREGSSVMTVQNSEQRHTTNDMHFSFTFNANADTDSKTEHISGRQANDGNNELGVQEGC